MESKHIQPPKRPRPYGMCTMLLMLISIIIMIFIVVVIFRIAWNNTMPQIFGVGYIDLMQAFLLIIVARILLPSSNTVILNKQNPVRNNKIAYQEVGHLLIKSIALAT